MEIANSVPVSNTDIHQFLRGEFIQSFFFPSVTNGEVTKYVMSLKNKKCSIDCLPAFIFKHASHIIAPVLCYLINLSMTQSVFPDCLKLASLFKSGDPIDISNYIPISVLNIVSKIIEKHAFVKLYSYLESNSILSERLYGFRVGRGTTQAIINHCNYI